MVLMFVEGEAKLATLRALHRALGRGGVLVLTEVLTDPGKQERQIHSVMHRRDATETRALLSAAGLARVTQPYQSLHTAIFVAWSES